MTFCDTPNEAEQISEIVDILFHYKTHSERMLLAVSELRKQSLILGYNWLKDHNPKVNWEKGEVEMICCPLWYERRCVLWKEWTHQKRTELQALWSCHDRLMPLFQEDLDLEKTPLQTCSPDWELEDWLFLIYIFPELTEVDLRATATTFQCLAEEARWRDWREIFLGKFIKRTREVTRKSQWQKQQKNSGKQ